MNIRRMMVAAAALAISAAAQNESLSIRVFENRSTPGFSNPLTNIGQPVHILAVLFPTAVADVTDFAVRLEGSYDNTVYVPIGPDVTAAYHTGTFSYALSRAGGVYPYVRVRITDASALPMTVYYTGTMQALGNIIFDGSRFQATAPAAQDQRLTLSLCSTAACAVGNNVTNTWIATGAGTWQTCYIAAQTPPTGSALTVRINKNGTAALTLSLTAADSYERISTFATPAFVEGDLFTADRTAIGSTVVGQRVTVTCIAR